MLPCLRCCIGSGEPCQSQQWDDHPFPPLHVDMQAGVRAGERGALVRRVLALLMLQVPSMPGFPPASQAVALRMALDIISAELTDPGRQPLANAHIFGPIVGRRVRHLLPAQGSLD